MVKRREDLTSPRVGAVASTCSTTRMPSGSSASRSPATSAPPASSCARPSSSSCGSALNLLAARRVRFDPWDRGLVLLTLVLSLQASYAAPLILLAQNRQEGRDRVQSDYDRRSPSARRPTPSSSPARSPASA